MNSAGELEERTKITNSVTRLHLEKNFNDNIFSIFFVDAPNSWVSIPVKLTKTDLIYVTIPRKLN